MSLRDQPAAVIIPARLQSRRIPQKPLQILGGLPLIEHVRRRALQATMVSRVVVATDSKQVAHAVSHYGGEVILTGEHVCGTNRVAEAMQELSEPYIVNVQGDMPLVDPAHIDQVVTTLNEGAGIVTLIRPETDEQVINDPAVVKVVSDSFGRAFYFSRAVIPPTGPWWVHIGIYGFIRSQLAAVTQLTSGPLALAEDLEQLSWLEAGYPISVTHVAMAESSVDTPEQLAMLRNRIEGDRPSRRGQYA